MFVVRRLALHFLLLLVLLDLQRKEKCWSNDVGKYTKISIRCARKPGGGGGGDRGAQGAKMMEINVLINYLLYK